MRIPAAYEPGYGKARALNSRLADNYIRHTVIGDPLADAAVEALAPHGQQEAHRLIAAGMEQRDEALSTAPPALQEFFARTSAPPPWVDLPSLVPGMRAYHQHSDLFIAVHVTSVLVSGFSTLISKSFFRTGRLTDYGVRRLQQNNRHLLEICLPGGLDRRGDAWKLSVRIRLVHAQIRRLLRQPGEWDERRDGTPISAAHMAFASAAFSSLLVEQARRVGARINQEEGESFVQIWRYVAWLFGVPETILFRDFDEGLELCRIGFMCEPEPSEEAILMANALINSAPLITGATDPKKRQAMAKFVYRVSRALVGDDLADQLRFPSQRTTGVLFMLKWQHRFVAFLSRLLPGGWARRRANNFVTLLQRSLFEEAGIPYRLPDVLDADRATRW